MRRKDREVTDHDEIMSMIDSCSIIRFGLADGDYPYIVPVNFSYKEDGGRLAFYIHGALAGRKYELLNKNGKCSFEMDIPLGMECIEESHDVTERYMSVMGTAGVSFVPDDEKKSIIDSVIMARYPETRNFRYNEAAISRTMIAKLTVESISAKANRPRSGADI